MAGNGTNGTKISAQQRRAIKHLLSEKTVADAANAAKVGKRTLYRWLAEDAEFVAELRQAESAMLDAATRRLLAMQDGALDALEGIVTDAEDESVRLRAALGILSHVLKLREIRDIESRLSALEAAIERDKR